MTQSVILAIDGEKQNDFTSEYPVLSISDGVDVVGIIEKIQYYLPELVNTCTSSRYSGAPLDPARFSIGICRFIELHGVWYYQPNLTNESILHRIVYGESVLRRYGTGEMFNSLRENPFLFCE